MRICERDMRTVLGRTLQFILKECNLLCENINNLTASCVKSNMTYRHINDDDRWIISIASELMECRTRNNELHIEGFTYEECKEMLKYVCTS